MNDTSYVKLKAEGKTTCFTTDAFSNASEIIAIINAAINTGSEGAELVDFVLTHSKSNALISDEAWEEIEAAQDQPTHDRTVSLDFDADRAVFSNWNGHVRTLLSGQIFRLTGCYEMALSQKGLDTNQFVANLLQHCDLQCIEHKSYPSFVMGGMT